MDMLFVIKQRLEELDLEQKDLAAGAKVTESYISQLLTRKKAPPAPERTDIYSKMEKSLKLPKGRLSKLAELHRKEEFERRVLNPPAPLFKEARKLILRKCSPGKAEQIPVIFREATVRRDRTLGHTETSGCGQDARQGVPGQTQAQEGDGINDGNGQ